MATDVALIICPPSETADDKLLGLTVGERLLLTLEKGGVSRVAFVGEGPRPASQRSSLDIVSPDQPPPGVEGFYLVSADTVFSPALLSSSIPEDLPLKALSVTEWAEIVQNPALRLEEMGVGQATSGHGFAIRVIDSQGRRLAERALMLSLKKPADGIISRYLNRNISMFISRRLARFPISPNQITAVVFLVGMLAGPFAFLGTHLGFAVGGFCYWFSAVLDGCDGEISRLKYRGSPLGAWLDTVVDDLVCLSYIVGMYLGLARNADHPYWLYLGGGATLFFLLTILPRYAVLARTGSGDFQKLAKATRPEKRGAVSTFFLAMRDIVFRTDFLPFAGMVTAVLGYPEVFAVPFAFGAVASAVDAVVTLVRYTPPKPA